MGNLDTRGQCRETCHQGKKRKSQEEEEEQERGVGPSEWKGAKVKALACSEVWTREERLLDPEAFPHTASGSLSHLGHRVTPSTFHYPGASCLPWGCSADLQQGFQSPEHTSCPSFGSVGHSPYHKHGLLPSVASPGGSILKVMDLFLAPNKSLGSSNPKER